MAVSKPSILLAATFAVLFAVYSPVPLQFFSRIARNAFLPGVPTTLPPMYPKTPDADLVRDVTMIVSTKDFVSCSPHHVEHLQKLVPPDMHVIYTYPRPVGGQEASDKFAQEMLAKKGPMTNFELMEMDEFSNPFRAWRAASEKITTKYTLFMHNDVYVLKPETFVSELYQGLQRNPKQIGSCPVIFESEDVGFMAQHVANANLHIIPTDKHGLLSHEMDAVKGTTRQPQDSSFGIQVDTLEDHAFLIRTEAIADIIDPEAAYTMEYMDLHMSVLLNNATFVLIPTVQIELRIWTSVFTWTDIAFFGYRRSERLARNTKHYLETKWGVEFPSTHFSNYVKFSLLRNVRLTADKLPSPKDWTQQAAITLGWFEWVGYNDYRVDGKAGLVTLPDLLVGNENFDKLEKFTAVRSLVHYIDTELGEISDSKASKVLDTKTAKMFVETRIAKKHLSFSVGKAKFASCRSPDLALIEPLCGLLMENTEDGSCTCWMYIAPFNYDNPAGKLLQTTLRLFKLAPRASLYAFMYIMEDMDSRRTEIESFSKIPGVTLTVCGENQERCDVDVEFTKSHKLIQWSGRLNQWTKVKAALSKMSMAKGVKLHVSEWSRESVVLVATTVFLHLTYMPHICLYWTAVIAVLYSSLYSYGITLPGTHLIAAMITVSHWPTLKKPSRYMIGGGILSYMYAYFINDQFLSPGETILVMSIISTVLAIRRFWILFLTFLATSPLSYIFPIVSFVLPPYDYTKDEFLACDGADDEVVEHRRRAFDSMLVRWNKKWPKSMEMSAFMKKNFSDLRFAAGNRVFYPFQKVLSDWCDPCTVVDQTDGTDLLDIDGERLIDISGSYGVNVVGYDKYQEFYRNGLKSVEDSSVVLGPIPTILLDNIKMLQEISGHPEISFHMSGTEAVMACVRLARFNTNKRLIVLFGGAYHGWWDGVQSAAGNERFAHDVLTLKDVSPFTLEVLRMRAHEIACVCVNPLQSFHPNSPPPSDLTLASNTRGAKETIDYGDWLQRLKKVCQEGGIVLVFDEVYTGFRLAKGGAQEYFNCKADMVCYGKTLGGGMPNGVVCGPSHLMKRSDGSRPSRVAYVIGTFAGLPLTLGCMNQFLKYITSPEAANEYKDLADRVNDWIIETNEILKERNYPLQLASYASVWTMLFNKPGRFHWMLQYYLKDAGLNLSWVGTGRLNFSFDFKDDDLIMVRDKLLVACEQMMSDGWWWRPSNQTDAGFAKSITIRVVKSTLAAIGRKVANFGY